MNQENEIAKPVTMAEAVAKFQAGQPCLLVEYRSSVAERIKWRDKESRATLEAPILRHNCEAVDGTPYIINERVDEKLFDEKAYRQTTFKKGDKALLQFATMVIDKGIKHFGGTLVPIKA